MEQVPDHLQEGSPPEVNYLPHHYVIKEDSCTTRLRVVFNASMKTASGFSLNNKLMVGPTIQSDIWDLLLRFRCHPIALVADVEKMFRQILVFDEDMDMQRILWRRNPDDPIKEYRLKTVTYGTASAPFLAVRVLQQLALDERENFPEASRVTLSDFYVDDLISGAHTVDQALKLKGELTDMFKGAGFCLRKWNSNASEVIQDSADEDAHDQPIKFSHSDSSKTLGISWCSKYDIFVFHLHIPEVKESVSKRMILSDISKLFDPLGLLAPIVIVAKLFMQSLWTLGVSWDQELPKSTVEKWKTFCESFEDIKDLHVNRCVISDTNSITELHGFSDASELAYGAVIYLRTINSQGEITVNLLCAKSKVAPLNQQSIPRLELCAAVLLAKLIDRTLKTLTLPISKVVAWCDSTIVLYWIQGTSKTWKTFVANRVSQIHQLLCPSQWHHVASNQNPADLVSRGLSCKELIQNQLWWKGPYWLSCTEQTWPEELAIVQTSEAIKEQRPLKLTSLTALENPQFLIDRYSSFDKLRRITALCLRFIFNCKAKVSERRIGPLTTVELKSACALLVKIVQHTEFSDVYKSIESDKHNHRLASLVPFKDSNGLLRVGGRLHLANLPYEQRHPLLLPHSGHLTTLVIRETHERHLHAGVQTTLAAIRQNFWIVHGRSTVRKVIHCCQRCAVDRARCATQQMGNLPQFRIEEVRPFLKCGVDFGGPFMIKFNPGRGGKLCKVYLAVFVCCVTKAVHLEPVTDLSAKSFIAAFRRFVSRRGHCTDIWSDNATNFVRSNRDLKEFLHNALKTQTDSDIRRFLAQQDVQWHFIPPRAPHFGGLWEAAIKSVKGHLRRVIGLNTLTFEEFLTLLTQIEAILNSRPLVGISNDPNDLDVLTPGHFLIGTPITSIPDSIDCVETRSHNTRWKMIQQLRRCFWKQWSREYLSELQSRPKWRGIQRNVKIGDLVILKEDHLPPLQWVKGRIMETFPGRDGLVRTVTVKTASGCFKRPIVKICILPIESC